MNYLWHYQRRAPFWFSALWFPGFLVACFYATLVFVRRFFARPQKFSIPTICVGNLSVGGTGKTPLVRALAERFRNKNPVIISRGYRSACEKVGGKVDLSKADGPARYGDEAWLLSQTTGLPVYVGRDRRQSLQRAIHEGAGLAVFDDGFQNFSVEYRTKIVMAEKKPGPQSRYTLPLGSLRDLVSSLRFANFLLYEQNNPFADLPNVVSEPIEFIQKAPVEIPTEGNWGLVCAIGDPETFSQQIQKKVNVIQTHHYPDHHAYSQSDIKALNRVAERHQLKGWITTTKDFTKLQRFIADLSRPMYVYDVEVKVADAWLKGLF